VQQPHRPTLTLDGQQRLLTCTNDRQGALCDWFTPRRSARWLQSQKSRHRHSNHGHVVHPVPSSTHPCGVLVLGWVTVAALWLTPYMTLSPADVLLFWNVLEYVLLAAVVVLAIFYVRGPSDLDSSAN